MLEILVNTKLIDIIISKLKIITHNEICCKTVKLVIDMLHDYKTIYKYVIHYILMSEGREDFEKKINKWHFIHLMKRKSINGTIPCDTITASHQLVFYVVSD